MNWFIFLFVSIVFIVSPYFTGLYSNSSFYSLSILIFSLYIMVVVVLLVKREISSLHKILLIFLLPLCYILSYPLAENPAGTWDSIIQWFTYTTFFFLVYWCAQTASIQKWLPVVFHVTGVWIAFYSMFLYLDFVQLSNGFIAGRLGSIFKYPNTFGMIMAVFFFFSLTMSLKDQSSLKEKCFYSFPIILHLLGFYLSYSRGMMLVFPIVWLVGVFLIGPRKQLRYVVYSAIAIGISLLAFVSLDYLKNSFVENGILLLSMIASVTLLYFSGKLLNRWEDRKDFLFEKKQYRFVLPVTITVLSFLLVMDLAYQGLVFRQLPNGLQDRIASIDIQNGTAKERLIFNEDAFEISKDSPIFGFGGEAFRVLYKKYQQFPYLSNKIHNGFAEWLVDTGWVGLIALFIVILYVYKQIIRLYREENERELRVAVILATLAIFLHSFLDFHFSYGTVWIFVFWLFAIGISVKPIAKQGKKKGAVKSNKQFVGTTILYSLLTIIVVVCSIFSYRFMEAERLAKTTVQLKDTNEKEKILEEAVALHPYKVEYWNKLSEVYLEKYKDDERYQKKINGLIAKITGLEPNNADVYIKSAELSEKIKDTAAAAHHYTKALSLDHFNRTLYGKSMNVKITLALEQKEMMNHSEYQNLIASAIQDYQQNIYLYDSFMSEPLTNHAAFNGRDFEVTYESHYYGALAYFLNEDYNQVVEIYQRIDQDQNGKFTALVMKAKEKLE